MHLLYVTDARVDVYLIKALREAGHVVEAADENEVKERLADDPWATAGLLQVATIEPWALWLDSRAENSAD